MKKQTQKLGEKIGYFLQPFNVKDRWRETFCAIRYQQSAIFTHFIKSGIFYNLFCSNSTSDAWLPLIQDIQSDKKKVYC